ncbi:hypothetical protein N7490_009009 [Penicillium lividum]|nr:hypothetical protein N7490_009009 [Penicillium lividum]
MKFGAILLITLLKPMLSQAIALPDSPAHEFDIAEREDDYNIHANLNGHSYPHEKSPNDNPLALEKKDTEVVTHDLSTFAS